VDECDGCASGTYSSGGSAYCNTVAAGYETNSDRTAAFKCSANHFSTGATDSCTPCEGGHSDIGSSSCVSTPPGHFWNGTADVPCPASTFSENGASDVNGCISCDGPGEFSYAGASYCKTALAGTKPNSLRTATELCPANYFSVGAADNCAPCPANGHSQEGSPSCDFCGLGEEFDADLNACKECAPGFASLGGTCIVCEGLREYTSSQGEPVCLLSPPGQMPNHNNTGTIDCPKNTDLVGCDCPINRFLSEDGLSCDEIPAKGVKRDVTGMTLATLHILPGFWRIDASSSDVRACPIADACTGGNSTTNCREGHSGPYCNLCDDGFAPDAFQLCQECNSNGKDVALTITTIVFFVAVLVGLNHVLNKKVFKKNPRIKKSVKTGLKILFVSFQILAALPSIVPAIQLPENYKEAVSKTQFLNLDLFQLVGVGCFSSDFNLNYSLLCTTLFPLAVCAAFIATKRRGAAIAVTFLVLPTVTTQLFKIFPCDVLTEGDDSEDAQVYLHADYSLSCDTASHDGFVAYGVIMIFVWPIGVLAMYSCLLFKNRAKINQPIEDRKNDEKVMNLAFLFDPYKPEYWWFEVFETTRRLAMTGVLGAISPGSDLQLGAGILMEVFATMVYCWCRPFVEFKDNVLGVLTNFMVLLVMLTALLLKRNEGRDAEEGIGAFLIFMNVLCVAAFVVLGVAQAYSYKHEFDNDKKGTNGLALGVLKKREKDEDEDEDGDEEGRGSSLLAAGRGLLARISSGAMDLGGRIFNTQAYREKLEAGVPGFAGARHNSAAPPPPAGQPGPNNSIFDIMSQKLQASEGDFEVAENPMLQNKDVKQVVNVAAGNV
jgi:hypothetical protein